MPCLVNFNLKICHLVFDIIVLPVFCLTCQCALSYLYRYGVQPGQRQPGFQQSAQDSSLYQSPVSPRGKMCLLLVILSVNYVLGGRSAYC